MKSVTFYVLYMTRHKVTKQIVLVNKDFVLANDGEVEKDVPN